MIDRNAELIILAFKAARVIASAEETSLLPPFDNDEQKFYLKEAAKPAFLKISSLVEEQKAFADYLDIIAQRLHQRDGMAPTPSLIALEATTELLAISTLDQLVQRSINDQLNFNEFKEDYDLMRAHYAFIRFDISYAVGVITPLSRVHYGEMWLRGTGEEEGNLARATVASIFKTAQDELPPRKRNFDQISREAAASLKIDPSGGRLIEAALAEMQVTRGMGYPVSKNQVGPFYPRIVMAGGVDGVALYKKIIPKIDNLSQIGPISPN